MKGKVTNSILEIQKRQCNGFNFIPTVRMQNSKMKENMKEVGKWKTEQEDLTSNSNFRRRKIK